MKPIVTSIVFAGCCLILLFSGVQAQTFWTEDFGTGCSQNQLADTYTGTNGAWAVTSTGVNESEGSTWYVSAKEQGLGAGSCGDDGCISGPTDRTLHVSASPNWVGDLGAAYEIGGWCGLVICVTANLRAESPTIDCSGHETKIGRASCRERV